MWREDSVKEKNKKNRIKESTPNGVRPVHIAKTAQQHISLLYFIYKVSGTSTVEPTIVSGYSKLTLVCRVRRAHQNTITDVGGGQMYWMQEFEGKIQRPYLLHFGGSAAHQSMAFRFWPAGAGWNSQTQKISLTSEA